MSLGRNWQEIATGQLINLCLLSGWGEISMHWTQVKTLDLCLARFNKL